MKKILLLAAIAISSNALAQETLTDITPKAYDWANQEVGTKMVIKHSDPSWNTPYTFSYTLGGSEYLENGGCISANNTTDPIHVMNGTAVVDLGEGIGKVMCINGANSKAQEVLGFRTDASIDDMIQINFFSNPDNTPRKQWIRCKIVLNIFSNVISTTDGVISNMYFMDADNNNKHADSSQFPDNIVNSAQFALYDEDGDPVTDEDENYVYDKNRWLTYEIDFFVMEEFKGDNYEGRTSQDMPVKWKMYMPKGGLSKSTIFIKELKFYTIDGYTDDKDEANWPAYARAPRLTYGPCPETANGVQRLSAAKSQNGIYNLAGQRVEQARRGVYVVNGKKFIK
ncbi:MAG: hypothetical protein J6W75_00025 [Bacteroidaceae bacterium]|nr:hypothetical protein [Bacteroidaceae bacterium]